MTEYQVDKLVSGSDKEKKLKRAERATEREVAKRRRATWTGGKGTIAKPQQQFSGPLAVTPWDGKAKGQIPLPKPQGHDRCMLRLQRVGTS